MSASYQEDITPTAWVRHREPSPGHQEHYTKNMYPKTGAVGAAKRPQREFWERRLGKEGNIQDWSAFTGVTSKIPPHYVGAASNTPARGTKNIIPRPCTPRPGRWGPRSGPVISYSNSQLSIALSQKPRFREVGGKVLFHSDYIENYRNE